jgi:hypothetical protein
MSAFPIFVQVSAYRDRWRRTRGVPFALGLALAGVLAWFCVAGLIPDRS